MFNSIRQSVKHATEDLDKFLDIRKRNTDDDDASSKYNSKNAMKNVVTPQSIPAFTVPPLLSNCLNGFQDEETNTADSKINTKIEFYNSSKNSAIEKERLMKNNQSEKRNLPQQPGLSLSHLLQSRSGFSTLKESPNTRRKESLFLSPTTTHYYNNEKKNVQKEQRKSAHLTSVIIECNQSSSDSEKSRNQTPVVSPMLGGLLKRRNNCFTNHRSDSESNSSCNTSPCRSPAPMVKARIRSESQLESKTMRVKNSSSYQSSTNNGSMHFASNSRKSNVINEKIVRAHVRSCSDNAISLRRKESPQIHVSLNYLTSQNRLDVSVVDIKNLTGDRLIYLKISLIPRRGTSHRSDTLRANTSNIQVREMFTFEGILQEEIMHLSLKISCKEKGIKLRTSTQLGVSILTLADIDFSTPHDTWLVLNDPSTEEVPHIQLSLCYHAMLGFVTIEVIAVRNVPKGPLGRNQDCYVVLTEAKASEGAAKKQTKISHRCKDPVFKQSFIFAMPNDQLVIIAALYVRDKIKGHWSNCGQIKLGHGVGDISGQNQWTQALDKEGQSVTFWHFLRVA